MAGLDCVVCRRRRLARNIDGSESGDAPKNGLFTDCDGEMDKLTKKKAVMSSGPAKTGA